MVGKMNKGRVGEGKSLRVVGRCGFVWFVVVIKVVGE